MATQNVPLFIFNRGLISPLALGRVDLDRTKLSAEVMTNFLPKTQGAMIIRPGTKHRGSTINDTGAYFIEFVASTNDAALLELTDRKMRVWMDDTGTISLLGRPNIGSLSLSVTDTGWTNASTGGNLSGGQTDQIPVMSAATTGGVTISASNENGSWPAWKAADDDNTTRWESDTLPTQWWMVDFGAGNTKRIKDYSIRCGLTAELTTEAPNSWLLQGNNTDTGWSDTGTTEATVSGESGWAVGEKRTYSDTGWTDTGANAWRYWRLNISAINGGAEISVAEIQLFEDSGAAQAAFDQSGITLNATARGSLAKAQKQVVVTDTGGHRDVEHSLALNVTRGPVKFRCGSTSGDDDYINETDLGTGHHNLAFTPSGNFHITVQNDKDIDRIVGSIAIGDTGTVEITTPWDATDLENIRYDQSADVVYVDAVGVHPYKIERRGTGRSWSVVKYQPENGPFSTFTSSTAKLNVGKVFGNTTLTSDIPFFKPGHEGALFRLTSDGQSSIYNLGAKDAQTDPIKVTGISDTGDDTKSDTTERRITFAVSGTYDGEITIERSFDDEEYGYKKVSGDFVQSGLAQDTGTFTAQIDDEDDNVSVWYRARRTDTGIGSGTAVVTVTYPQGLTTGIVRAISYNTNTSMDVEVLKPLSDTGTTDDWQEAAWSGVQGYPSVPSLHEGRLAHAGKANIWISVSDDYENFDDETEGDAGPLNRTLGSGPVDNIYGLLSLSRLVATTAGSEIVIKSSSLDEPLTPTNSSAKAFSTQGSANIRMLPIDSRGVFVQRSRQRVYAVAFGQSVETANDFESSELTVLVPELLKESVVSMAVQRQPDTRLHCVLGDGKVAILTYEPQEEVLSWSMWETDGTVERAMVLPGVSEDKVFYHVNRTINGVTRRFLEQWAMESECQGDTGLSWLADCAASYTDTGRTHALTGFDHLEAESVIVWGDDTGQTDAGRDLSYDTGTPGYSQKRYTVTTGQVTLDTGSGGAHHAVVGLPYTADYKSTKLAYAAQFGTALAQWKRIDKIAFILNQIHNNGLFFGSDTGNLDPLPRVSDEGATVDGDKIFPSWDNMSKPFPGKWNTDSRVHMRAVAPRPAAVMAMVPTVTTNEKV